jgi:hypothetical protein
MGSFTDLPIKQTGKLKMDKIEARSYQFRLAEKVGEIIDQDLKRPN